MRAGATLAILATTAALSNAEVALKNASDKLTIGGEVRARAESRQNFDYNSLRDDENSFMFLRSRLGVRLDATDDISAFIQIQDARTFGDEPSTVNDDASVDLRQGWFEARKFFGSPVAIKVGRQELAYGSERLIGGLDWSNVGRSFDAVKLTVPIGAFSVDLFGATLVESNANDNDLSLYGLVGTWKGSSATVMPYVFLKRDGRGNFVSERNNTDTGNLEDYTAGLYWTWKVNDRLNVDAEGAYQFGNWSSDDIRAWAAHAGASYILSTKYALTISGEGNWATGDENSTDGERESFDNLYPTNHKFYGYGDFAQWNNAENYRVGLSIKPSARTTLSADYHFFRLDTTNDAWRNAGGATVMAARTFASDRDLGGELDLLVKHKYNDHLEFLGGYSIFRMSQANPANGLEENAQFWYLQSRFHF
jgi:hypothetical protein